MRGGLVAVGIILAVLGAALLFVPLLPESNQTVNSSSDTPYYVGSVDGFSLTGSIPVAVSWSVTGSTAVEVAAATCSGSCSNVSEVSGITYENGTSGSFTLSQPNGGSVIMGVIYDGAPGVTVTFKITVGLATEGTALLLIGILVLIVGVVARGPAKAAATPTPPSNPPAAPPPS